MAEEHEINYKIRNYDFWQIFIRLGVVSIFCVLCYFIFLKLFNHQFSVIMVILIANIACLYVLFSRKEIIFHSTHMVLHKVFIRKKTMFNTNEVYLNVYFPPSATWFGEQVQIRLLKNDKLIFEFNKEDNKHLFKFLSKTVEIRKW